jgi:hypothetical protein
MAKIKLHYAKIDSHDNIECFEFDEGDSAFNDFMLHLETSYFPAFGRLKKVVYLFCYVDEIFISDNIDNVLHFMESAYYGFNSYTSSDFWDMHLQEYPSFEEAYKVALDINEVKELCYSSETQNSPYWLTKFNNNEGEQQTN